MQHRRKLFSAVNPRWWPPNRIYFYLSLGMILFDQMLANQRRRSWCYLVSVDFTTLYGYHHSLYLCMYIFMLIFFRFGGRHLGLSAENNFRWWCIKIITHLSRWNFVASSFVLWYKCTSGLAADILKLYREFEQHLHHKIFNNYRLLQIASKV